MPRGIHRSTRAVGIVNLGSGNDSYECCDYTSQGYSRKVFGGTGNDRIVGSADLLSGGGGRAFLSNGKWPGRLSGGPGPDTLFGKLGKDKLNGGSGRDFCHGGGDRDTAVGCENVRRVPRLLAKRRWGPVGPHIRASVAGVESS